VNKNGNTLGPEAPATRAEVAQLAAVVAELALAVRASHLQFSQPDNADVQALKTEFLDLAKQATTEAIRISKTLSEAPGGEA
jgi:hypothetical protein